MQSPMLIGLRKSNGLSQHDMAEILGISRGAYRIKEDDIEKFTGREIYIIIKHFKKSYDQIFGAYMETEPA